MLKGVIGHVEAGVARDEVPQRQVHTPTMAAPAAITPIRPVTEDLDEPGVRTGGASGSACLWNSSRRHAGDHNFSKITGFR